MNWRHINILFCFIYITACHQGGDQIKTEQLAECSYPNKDSTPPPPYANIRGALLGSRFASFEELKSVLQIVYDSTGPGHYRVTVRHCSGGREAVAVLETGVSQGDMLKARYDNNVLDRLYISIHCPFAIINRKNIEKVYTLSRWRYEKGDLAFIDIAKSSTRRINTPEFAFITPRDSSEKGYINSFNHITAQAFITSCFSEDLADFIADSHELYRHPELITGRFTEAQIYDLGEGPLDNYIDLINNEWGQNIGKQLKKKYKICPDTYWTPELLANYLNDLQGYYSWAFQIGFIPYRPDDEEVVSFSNKINEILRGY